MGGYGSGRKGFRDLVENFVRLDIGIFSAAGFQQGHHGDLKWEGISAAAICEDDRLVIVFNHHSQSSEEPNKKRIDIRIDFTPAGNRSQGGRRAWFICRDCGKRRAHLYYEDLDFSCRECLNLLYVSQSTIDILRYWQRYEKLESRLAERRYNTPAKRKLEQNLENVKRKAHDAGEGRADMALRYMKLHSPVWPEIEKHMRVEE